MRSSSAPARVMSSSLASRSGSPTATCSIRSWPLAHNLKGMRCVTSAALGEGLLPAAAAARVAPPFFPEALPGHVPPVSLPDRQGLRHPAAVLFVERQARDLVPLLLAAGNFV